MKNNIISPAEIDFWLDDGKYTNYFNDHKNSNSLIFNVDLIRLSSIRKSISNFVRILTRRNIPVYFSNTGENVNIGGNIIYISSEINSKKDFDVTVGLALHEGAHTLKSDFDVVKVAWTNIPHNIFAVSDKKNIRRTSIEKFIHAMCNVIEDRYIDDYVFRNAPGYRGYYVALYDEFWNDPKIGEYLASDLFRYPSLESYRFRITNFTNESTDLLALPRFDEIANLIDLSNIRRLKTTRDRIEVSFKIIEIVLDCIDENKEQEHPTKSNTQSKLAKPQDFFDFGDPMPADEEVDVGKKIIGEICEVSSGECKDSDDLPENKDMVNKISKGDIDPEIQKEIKKVTEIQRKFLSGELPKVPVDSNTKDLLDLIERHGIMIVRVDVPMVLAGDEKNLKVDCIVVQKMTKELILSGTEIFPLCGVKKFGNEIPMAPPKVLEAVTRGIQIGSKLGRKLQIRNEINCNKDIRKKSGKINKRQLHEASFDAEDLFYKIRIGEYSKATLHITVDASSSMNGKKWERTMTSVVAICKAASMIDNVHVSVSFRTTQDSSGKCLPYVIMAYNSDVDKFSKVKNLFPYLVPNGCTPEGLAFGAIMNLFDSIIPDEEDRYFLNLSDGEPCYQLVVPSQDLRLSYYGEVGTTHTKHQVDKIRKLGVNILSYFVSDEEDKYTIHKSDLKKNFKKMYGEDAKFINVESVVDLAYTMNKLFLKGTDEKSS